MAQSSRPTTKDITLFSKAPWWRRLGFGTDETGIDDAYSNNYRRHFASADGQSDIEAYSVDSDDLLKFGGEGITPMWSTINFPLATNASIVAQPFFIAPYAMVIRSISCVFATADGAANTGYITHETSGVTPGSGTSTMIGTFNLNATANTVQNATLPKKFPSASSQTSPYGILKLAAGDRLSFKIASAVTSLAGLVISMSAAPGGKGTMVQYAMNANGDLIDQTFFVANRDFIVSRIDYAHATKGTNGSAVTLDLKKCTGTQAAASGTTLLSATFDCKAANNTVQNGALTATTANLRLGPGDRLAVDFTGTLTALAGVVVIVTLQPTQARKEVTWAVYKNANLGVTQAFFVADRNYEIIAASEVHAVAAGGVSTLQVTRDKVTDAPGAGTSLLTSAFNLNGTAETVIVGALTADARANFLMAGDRISVKFANAAQSSAGVVVTVSLVPR